MWEKNKWCLPAVFIGQSEYEFFRSFWNPDVLDVQITYGCFQEAVDIIIISIECWRWVNGEVESDSCRIRRISRCLQNAT